VWGHVKQAVAKTVLRAEAQRKQRVLAQPEAAQAALLDRLGIVLPKRIRVPEIALDLAERAAA